MSFLFLSKNLTHLVINRQFSKTQQADLKKSKFIKSFRKYSLAFLVIFSVVTFKTLPYSSQRPQILARNRLEKL
jgi:hypothetical protein